MTSDFGQIEVTEKNQVFLIEIAGLDPRHDGVRIAHLSDIHVGSLTPPEHIRAAIDQLADEAQGHLKTAFGLLADAPSGARRIFLPLACVRQELNRARRVDYDPFLPRPVSRLRTLWTLWRAARTEEFGS